MENLQDKNPITKELPSFNYTFFNDEDNPINSYVDIKNKDASFFLHIGGKYELTHFLHYVGFHANDDAFLNDFANLVFATISSLRDEKLAIGIIKLLNQFSERLEAQAAEDAENVSEEDEAISQIIMEAFNSPHNSEQFKQDVRDALTELQEENKEIDEI